MRKFTRKLSNVSNRVKTTCVVASGVAMAIASTIPAFADTATVDSSITAGFTQAGATTLVIIASGVAATVSVIAASGGAKAGLKWIKGVFAKAS